MNGSGYAALTWLNAAHGRNAASPAAKGCNTDERPRDPGAGLRLAGRPRDPWRSERSSASTPMPPRCFLPARAPSRSSARCAFPFLDYSTLAKRKQRLRGGARGQPAVRARNLPRRRADHARAGRPARARRRRHAGRMGGRNAPLRRGCDPRPAGGGGPGRCDPCRRARPRGGGGACRRRPRSMPARGSRRWPTISTSTSRPSARAPELFPGGGGRRARAREPRRLCAHPPAPARARTARSRPPHPRRSPSRQYRPARRPAGAVRRHRIQPADRVRATCSTISRSC